MKSVVRLLALFVVVGFVAWFVVANWSAVQQQLAALTWWQLLLAVVSCLVGLWFAMLAWRAMMRSLGSEIPVFSASRVYFLGQLGKYVPGSVWPIVAQAELARDYGASRLTTGVATLVQMLLSVLTGVIFAAITMLFGGPDVLAVYWWMFPVAAVGIICLVPAVFNRLLGLAAKVLRREIAAEGVAGRALLVAAAWCMAMWVCFGAHFALLGANTLSGAADVATASGAYALAWVVGFLIVFVPAGAGAREGALVLALAPIMAAPTALGLALVSRFVMLAGDLITALAAVLVARSSRGAARDAVRARE